MTASVAAGLAVYERAADQGGAPLPIVVLVHGSMDRGASFIKVQKRLRHRHVIRYDRRGYARSRAVDPSGGLTAHVDDLLGLVGEGPAVVIGHSFGGLVALAAAASAEVGGRIVGVGSFEAPMGWAPWWPVHRRIDDAADPAAVAEGFMRRIIGDDRWSALPQRTQQERRAEGRAVIGEVRSVGSGVAPFDVAAVEVPVTCGYGTASAPHLQRAAVELAAEVPTARVEVIEGAGHDAHVTHPDAFTALVEAVIASSGAPPPSIGR